MAHRLRFGGTCVGLALAFAAPAAAFDSLSFDAPGAGPDLRDALRGTSLLVSAEREGLSDPLEVFSIARAEYGRLIGALYEAGHYSALISVRIDGREAAEISPLTPPEVIGAIEVEVTPGPVFVFGRAEIGPLAPGTELPAGFAPGRTAESALMRDAARAAVDGWRDVGHAKAETAGDRIVADHRAEELDAEIDIAPGPRLRFGDLSPQGQVRTRPERIIEIAGLPTGEVFSPQAVEQAATRLRRTGTFASVAVREAETPNPDDTLDFAVSVVEAPPRRIGAGAEFDTEDGVRLSAFWLHRNLLGGAERFRIEGEIGGIGARSGGIDYRLRTEFTRPATFTPDTSLSLGAVVESEDQRDFAAERARLRASITHLFSDTLTAEAGIEFQIERARFGVNRNIRRNFGTFALPLGVIWDRRDDPLDASEGFYVEATATPFLGIADAGSGAQVTLDGRGYYALDADGDVVLAGRGMLGAVIGAEIARTPRNYLFYSGGGGTVRGQPFESLGVTVDGVDSGGQGFAALSGEVRAQVRENVGLVGFADAGYVSTGAFSGAADWHAGAGVGVRYDTAVGPLRLDVGLPVRGDTGRGVQVYIGIGQAF